MSWTLARVGTWLLTSKWERRTIREKRWAKDWKYNVGDTPFHKMLKGRWNWWFILGDIQSVFQGVTHQQWYLFNDFLIEPIDKVNISPYFMYSEEMLCFQSCKCVATIYLFIFLSKTEAAQFDVSWKVPAILYYAKRNYHTKYNLRSTYSDIKWEDFPRGSSAAIDLLSLCCLPQLKTP